jgi:hypothetical protein
MPVCNQQARGGILGGRVRAISVLLGRTQDLTPSVLPGVSRSRFLEIHVVLFYFHFNVLRSRTRTLPTAAVACSFDARNVPILAKLYSLELLH